MTWADRSRLDELREAVRQSDAGGDSHEPSDHRPIESDADAKAPTWTPFPLEALPEIVCAFVRAVSESLHSDTSMVAAPVLGALAGAIGNRRRIALSPDWSEPSVLWVMAVAPPSSMKSPALEKATDPLQAVQRRLFAAWQDEMKTYESAGGEGPKPIPERIVVSDTTIEALADRLCDNPGGLTLIADEGSTWLGGFDRYRQHGRTDAAQWCSIWSGKPIWIDRKSGERKTIQIPRPCVSIVGTSQPQTLRRCLTDAFFESGLAARLILVSPPRCRKRWRSGSSVDPQTIASMQDVIESLIALRTIADENGAPSAKLIPLDKAAEREWANWYDANARREETSSDDRLRGLLGKGEAHVARLALVVHCVRVVTGELDEDSPIDVLSMAAGIELGDWLTRETWRTWLEIAEDDDPETARLIEWIAKRDGSVTVRDLQHSSGERFPRADDARAALEELVKAGLGNWSFDPPPKGGGPQRERFTLTNATAPTNDKRGDSDP